MVRVECQPSRHGAYGSGNRTEHTVVGGARMEFYEILTHVITLLQRERRVSYRALKRQFSLDDDVLEDLKEELVYAKRLAVDEEGRVLVWVGDAGGAPEPGLQ